MHPPIPFLYTLLRSTLSLLFSGLKCLSSLSLFSHVSCFSPFINFVTLCWTVYIMPMPLTTSP